MTFYDFLNGIKDELEKKIVDFYNDRIHGKFPDSDCKFQRVIVWRVLALDT